MAILVTIFGSASAHASQLAGATVLAQADHAFTTGATHAFGAAALLLIAAFTLVAVAVRAPDMNA